MWAGQAGWLGVSTAWEGLSAPAQAPRTEGVRAGSAELPLTNSSLWAHGSPSWSPALVAGPTPRPARLRSLDKPLLGLGTTAFAETAGKRQQCLAWKP